MKRTRLHSLWTALALTLAVGTPLHAQAEVGEKAPEINAKEWLNSVGLAPSLETLRGQAVVLEFWATW